MTRTRERTLAIAVAVLAAAVLAGGVFAEQLGETLFNATLV
jgi:hypothetical protein